MKISMEIRWVIFYVMCFFFGYCFVHCFSDEIDVYDPTTEHCDAFVDGRIQGFLARSNGGRLVQVSAREMHGSNAVWNCDNCHWNNYSHCTHCGKKRP
jgi:hypothetical protein